MPRLAVSHPLVTVAFPCFNQEKYVESALRSVLAQRYQPLEIVISDDSSTDASFEIMQDLVLQYSGPHDVQLYRNEQRMGVENYNRLMALSKGQFVVMAHSDDIALPFRVERMAMAWQQKQVSLVSSNSIVIDEDGNELGLEFPVDQSFEFDSFKIVNEGYSKAMIGSTLAWDRRVFDDFGPLNKLRSAVSTDFILPFRASLLDGIHYVSEPLMLRRVHDQSRANAYLGGIHDEETKSENLLANCVAQYIYMLQTVQNYATRPEVDQDLCKLLKKQIVAVLIQSASHWSQTRNLLLANGRKCVWEDVVSAHDQTEAQSKIDVS